MTEHDGRFKQQEAESKEEKWYTTFWDFIIPNEPEDELGIFW